MTKYGRMIYEIINQSSAHLTAEQIFQEMQKFYPQIVLASVYNNLNKLWQEGLIRKISLEGEADRYDKTIKHDHLVCRCCGQLADITLSDLTEKLCAECRTEILAYDLKIYYICPKCQQEKNCQGKKEK